MNEVEESTARLKFFNSRFVAKHPQLTITNFRLVQGQRMYRFKWMQNTVLMYRWENLTKIEQLGLVKMVEKYEKSYHKLSKDEQTWYKMLMEEKTGKNHPYTGSSQRRREKKRAQDDNDDSSYEAYRVNKRKKKIKQEIQQWRKNNRGTRNNQKRLPAQSKTVKNQRDKARRLKAFMRLGLLQEDSSRKQEYFTYKVSKSVQNSDSQAISNSPTPNTVNVLSSTSNDYKPIAIALQQLPQQKILQIEKFYHHNKCSQLYQDSASLEPEPYQPSIVSETPQQVFTSEEEMEIQESDQLVEISEEVRPQEKVTDIREFVVKQLKELNIYNEVQLNEDIIGPYCNFHQERLKEQKKVDAKQEKHQKEDNKMQIINEGQSEQDNSETNPILKQIRHFPLIENSLKQQRKQQRQSLNYQYCLEYILEHLLPENFFKEVPKPKIIKVNRKVDIPKATLFSVQLNSIFSSREYFLSESVLKTHYPELYTSLRSSFHDF